MTAEIRNAKSTYFAELAKERKYKEILEYFKYNKWERIKHEVNSCHYADQIVEHWSQMIEKRQTYYRNILQP